jgi:hypothetical protein
MPSPRTSDAAAVHVIIWPRDEHHDVSCKNTMLHSKPETGDEIGAYHHERQAQK